MNTQEQQVYTPATNHPVASINNDQELQNLLFNHQAMAQLHALATTMASSKISVPAHFRGNVGDCMAVCMQAAQWRMNPYAVAQKMFIAQGGQLAYEAQLVNAVVTSNAPIKSRLDYEFLGNWEKILGKVVEREGKGGGKYFAAAWNQNDEEGLGVRVYATLKGEDTPRELHLLLKQCYPRFSTQWATDPQQQITYLAVKKWARRFCPDVILGVYTPDELQDYAPAERDITPRAASISTEAFLSAEQVATIKSQLADIGYTEQKLAEVAGGFKSLQQIPASGYTRVIQYIDRVKEKRAAIQSQAQEASEAEGYDYAN